MIERRALMINSRLKKIESFLDFKKPIIEFNEKKYIFSIRSLVLLAFGAQI
jgi:hypothetical protein